MTLLHLVRLLRQNARSNARIGREAIQGRLIREIAQRDDLISEMAVLKASERDA